MSLSIEQVTGADELLYPSGDGEPVAETPLHFNALVLLVQALQDFLATRLDLYIGANMFWYFEKGNPSARRAPDVMVIKGVGRASRRSFFSWREGNAVPCLILELASAKTFGEDLTEKRAVYARLRVREYFLFDPEGRYLKARLIGFRLDEIGEYQPIEADDHGRLHSLELDFSLRAEEQIVRVFDGLSGSAVLSREERAESERQRAESERQRADSEKRSNEEANRRADAEKLRAELAEKQLAELKALLMLKSNGTEDAATKD